MRIIHLFLLIAIIPAAACKSRPSYSLEKMKALNNYPSGSGIAYSDNKIYLMGDDAAFLLITDTGFNRIDTISFFSSPTKRIAKSIKADLEAAAMVTVDKVQKLLIIGSGSLAQQRNDWWIVDPSTKEKLRVNLDTFYNRLKTAGIKDLNIEGATAIPGAIVLASRGNKSYPRNRLIFTSQKFWMDQTNAPISIANIGTNKDTASFHGVSGLEYSKLTDRLLLTFSTEDTYSPNGDGAIGKSYLWIVDDITTKRNYAGINPTQVIDMETIDSRFNKQKIESVCIITEKKKEAVLVFVSDDDKGGSVLFKVRMTE